MFTLFENTEGILLNITAVHPIREEAIRKFLNQAHTDWSLIEKLIDQEQLSKAFYAGKTYYMRKATQC